MQEDILQYEGTVIRPPSEAESLIFQVTLGCSDNKCIFCPAYKDKKYAEKSLGRIEEEFRAVSRALPEARKIFLADGDAMALPQDKLRDILLLAGRYFPALARVSLYGSVKSLEGKSAEGLAELKKLKLGTVYLGFETGDEEVYRFIRKYGSPEGNVEACLKVKEAGLKVNVTVIAGLGGKKLSEPHAVNTAAVLSRARPQQIAVLTLMTAPGTPLYGMRERGEFEELDAFEMISETKLLLEKLLDFRCQFFANHASNFYPVAARFPRDKAVVIEALGRILKERKRGALRPDLLRGL